MNTLLHLGHLLAATALVAGIVPLVVRRTDRLLHLLVALATGLLFGMVFVHMLPQVAQLARGSDDGGAGRRSLWLFVLLGFFALYLIESLLVSRAPHGNDRERHATLGYASLTGLSIHAFIAGLSLASLLSSMPEFERPLLGAVLGHKAAEGFSLGSVFLLAGFSRRRSLALLTAFALVTPAGLWLGGLLLTLVDTDAAGLGMATLTALATGTFLFVALCDLLPEVFHHRVDAVWKVALVLCGIALSVLIPE